MPLDRGRYLHNVDIPLPKAAKCAGLRLIDCGGAIFCFKCCVASFFGVARAVVAKAPLFGGWSLGLADRAGSGCHDGWFIGQGCSGL